MTDTATTDTDRFVWFCPSGEWVAEDDGSYFPCWHECGPVKYSDLPAWAKQELDEDG